MRKLAVVVFCLLLGPVAAQSPVVCPEGMVCLTREQAAAIVARFNEMAAVLDQAADMLEKQQKTIERLKAATNCS